MKWTPVSSRDKATMQANRIAMIPNVVWRLAKANAIAKALAVCLLGKD